MLREAGDTHAGAHVHRLLFKGQWQLERFGDALRHIDGDDGLYTALGQKKGIRLLIDDLVDRLRAEKTIGPMFKNVKAAYLKEQLTDQLGRVSGGACAYVGAKWRVAGNAVLDSDNWQPQVAVGVQFKSLHSSGLDGTLSALGAEKNGTLRATNANQNGLLGFGGTLGGARDQYQLMPELSVAWLANRHLAVGMEYRRMPNNLQDPGEAAGLGDGLRAQDWKDVFAAWAPNKNASVTLAYVDLRVIVACDYRQPHPNRRLFVGAGGVLIQRFLSFLALCAP